jgi:hypothetical protein
MRRTVLTARSEVDGDNSPSTRAATNVVGMLRLVKSGDAHEPLGSCDDADDDSRLRDVLGDVLRDERRRQGRTLADVAETAAVSLPYLSEVERGRKDVSSDVLAAIGGALELPLVEILERSARRLRVGSQGRSGIQLRAA